MTETQLHSDQTIGLPMALSEKIVWLAAYPKTGSSWIRVILHALLGSVDKVNDAVPKVHRAFPDHANTYALINTRAHLLRTHCHAEHPILRDQAQHGPGVALGLITIQRHPLDVLLSQLNYAFVRERAVVFRDRQPKRAEAIIADGEIDQYVDRFLECGGCPEYLERCGTYLGFYSGWAARVSGKPHLRLRYEEMVADPLAGIEAIRAFLQLSSRPADLVFAEVERRTKLDGEFFWRKRAYNHRDLLAPETIARFEQGFAGPLRELGYDPA